VLDTGGQYPKMVGDTEILRGIGMAEMNKDITEVLPSLFIGRGKL
jgi:hypothetical protein